MKKRLLALFMAVVTAFSLIAMSYAAEDEKDGMLPLTGTIDLSDLENNPEVTVSEAMTFSEMAERYAESAGITYMEALEMFPHAPTAYSVNDIQYRIFSARVAVTEQYKPSIDFYCVTAEGGSFRDIKSIYAVHLDRVYGSLVKQFTGEIEFWLRSRNSIEYIIDGDFYNTGTTSFDASLGTEFGIDELGKIAFTIGGGSSTSFYAPCYDHATPVFFP